PDVVEVEPVVALSLEVDARRQPLLERAERYGSADAETSAVVKAFEVDVGEGRGILEAARNAEDRERRLAAALELAPHRDPSLSLSDILPGHLREVGPRCGVAVYAHLVVRQRARIIGPRVPPHVRLRRERPAGGEREMPPRIQIAATGIRLLPLAGVIEPRHRQPGAARADAARRGRLPLVRVGSEVAGRGRGPASHVLAGGPGWGRV